MTSDSTPAFYRVPVTEIERRTGIDFGEVVRLADQVSEGTSLILAVRDLNAPDEAVRKATAQRLISALRDGPTSPSAQRDAVAAMITALAPASFLAMSPAGRVNLALTFSEIPSDNWTQPSWATLQARAVEAMTALGELPSEQANAIGPRTRELLRLTDARLGRRESRGAATARPGVTVHLQFTVMPRWKAQEIRDGLRDLGWTVPGEERVKQVGINEIRFDPSRPEEVHAAETMQADLADLGYGVLPLASNPSIAPGTIEVWISAP